MIRADDPQDRRSAKGQIAVPLTAGGAVSVADSGVVAGAGSLPSVGQQFGDVAEGYLLVLSCAARSVADGG
jgi:hypothetical protein